MSRRRFAVAIAWRELTRAVLEYVRDGTRLARCRLTGGHRMGTWRLATLGEDHTHTWCRRCGWCEQQQSFAEEREWEREGWGPDRGQDISTKEGSR